MPIRARSVDCHEELLCVPACPLPMTPRLTGDDCRLLVESVTDYAIFLLDPAGHVRSWNAGAERIKGWSSEEIVGQHFSRFYPVEDVARGKPAQELELALAHGRVEDEGWRLRKDGTRFWANVVITALYGVNDELRGFGKVTRDLTQRRFAEQRLRESEERFHHLVDAVSEYAIYALDPEGHVSTWNVGAQRIKQWHTHEILGQHFRVFYPPEERLAGRPERILEIVRREGRYEDEAWRVRKDGTRFWANVVISVLRDERGEVKGFVKVTRDLTARRAAEETERSLVREQAARAAAEEASRMKDDFLAIVSHELRTPLNAILGWAALLETRREPTMVTRGLDVIHRNARTQARLVDDILDVSRVVSGKLKLELVETSFDDIVHEVVESLRPTAEGRGVALDVEPASRMPTVVGDPERLRQIVWNLISNAIKFSEPGGRVTVALGHDRTSVTLTVRDEGLGIHPQLLPHVFDRFRQGDSSPTRRAGGLGLGLAIVRHLVEMHGGTVRAESEGEGRGATFVVELRTRAAFPVPAGAAAAPAVSHRWPVADPLAALRIVVVEDDDDAREVLATLLTGAGAEVETAPDAPTALRLVAATRPDVLVSDIGMPGEDGHSLLRRVRALPEADGGKTPAIALTAYTRAEDRAAALDAGFDAHVPKPLDPGRIIAAITRLVGRT